MQAPATPTYFAHVDGLRAVAVLAVMLYHLNPSLLPGGFVGVDVFFVISGFVVTASLAGHRDERLPAFLGRFYARRLARLGPALVLMLVAATALYVLFVPRAWFNRAAETVGQAAFWGLSNWVLDRQAVNYFEPRAELNPFVHTWSLGVEEQFYLIAPLFLFAALGLWRARRARPIGVAAVALAAAASFVACYFFGVTLGARQVFYQVVFRFWELAAGVLLFLLGPSQPASAPAPRDRRQWLQRLAAGAGLLLVLLAMTLPKPQAYPWVRATVAVAGTLLLIGLPGHAGPGAVRRALAHRAAVWIGLRSYSLYLWHWPIYVLARWTTGLAVWPFNALAVALTFAAATASYRFVEAPVRGSRRLGRLPVPARLALFVLMLGAGWLAGRALLAHQPALGLGQPTRHAADWYPERGLLKTELAADRRCTPVRRHSPLAQLPGGTLEFVPEGCPATGRASLFVIGDSHATAYLPLLEQMSAEQGRLVKVLQAPGCGYADLMQPLTPAAGHCHRMATAAMRKVLAEGRPGDIVFLPSLRLPRLILLGGEKRAAGSGDVFARTAQELQGIRAAAEDASAWTAPFAAAGLQVLIEAPKPLWRAHPFACVDWFNRANPDCAGGLGEQRADLERYRAPMMRTLQELTRRHAGLQVWDPMDTLCDGGRCAALRDGRPLYFDGDHLSPYGNLLLWPSLRQAVNRLDPR